MKDIVEVAVQEFKDTVMVRPAGERRQARAQFVSKLNECKVLGVVSEEEFWSVLRSIRLIEEEERSQDIRKMMKELDAALALCYMDIMEAKKKKLFEEEQQSEMNSCF